VVSDIGKDSGQWQILVWRSDVAEGYRMPYFLIPPLPNKLRFTHPEFFKATTTTTTTITTAAAAAAAAAVVVSAAGSNQRQKSEQESKQTKKQATTRSQF
jgi:hypothetical protein